MVIFFCRKQLLVRRPNPKLEDHPLSAVRDCLFNVCAGTLPRQSENAPRRGDWNPVITRPRGQKQRQKQDKSTQRDVREELCSRHREWQNLTIDVYFDFERKMVIITHVSRRYRKPSVQRISRKINKHELHLLNLGCFQVVARNHNVPLHRTSYSYGTDSRKCLQYSETPSPSTRV